jgi:UDP-glucose 4-epimerase
MAIKNKTFLVTGGAGFIGSHTSNALLKKGARVVIVDNLSTGRKENLPAKAKFYEMDLADPKLEAVFKKEKPDYVYHFAFNVLVPKSVDDPIMDAQSIIASLNLIKNASRAKVKKVIFSSSGFLYGNKAKKPTDENAEIDPITPYVVSKNAVEHYLRFYKKTFNMPYVVLRYAAVYGPGQVTGAMADYIRKLRADSQAQIWGDGTKTRDYTYIEDVVRANLLALNVDDDFTNPIFNVGTGKETTLNELYKFIAAELKKPFAPIYLPDRPAEQMRYSLDHKKIKKTLGWSPTVSVKEGVQKILKFTNKN